MAERIAHHRARRPAAWLTLEVTTGVAHAVREALASISGDAEPTVLVEDLTLLLSNLPAGDAEARAMGEVETLCALPANVILVSNEVGMGIVPPYPSGRQFRDALGRVNQRAAALCDEAYFVVAGVPLRLK
jgi:adenosylcobinamide kinase/adenosylcobinamide-phosphate guanylyltransferase